jgi:hypothetical protein
MGDPPECEDETHESQQSTGNNEERSQPSDGFHGGWLRLQGIVLQLSVIL